MSRFISEEDAKQALRAEHLMEIAGRSTPYKVRYLRELLRLDRDEELVTELIKDLWKPEEYERVYYQIIDN